MRDELRLRVRMLRAGLVLSAVLLVAMGAWIALTWERPHRQALAGIVVVAAVLTLALAALPHARIVAGRHREAFFLAWSLSLVLLVGLAARCDAGVRSPVVLILFLTLVFAALSYPRRSVAVVSGASLLTVLGLSRLGGPARPPTDPIYLAGLMFTLAITGIMCMLQARIQQEARAELMRVSHTDPLTGVLNRLGFQERLSAELARAGASLSLALVLLDFDNFKRVNDSHGHAAGDELLCWAARTIEGMLRPEDACGRLGGDEFAVLLPGTSFEQAGRIAERVQRSLGERTGVSAGVAVCEDRSAGADALYRRADVRLYADKRGRASGQAADLAVV